MIHTPAEHHSSTGDVERSIGEVRHKMETFLRNEPTTPSRAAHAMMQAHNHVARVGGYSPSQWALGHSENANESIPALCAQGTPGHAMAETLRLRLDAEHLHSKLSAAAKISRAMNSRAKPTKQFLPGDLVYYLRHKPPRRAPANRDVDVVRLRIARWYGPAKVLASETRVDDTGTSRMAASVIWLVSGGRLLKVHGDQLRHSSERERLIANATDTLATPWTFSMLSTTLEKGAFEDLTTSRAERFERKRRQIFRPSLPQLLQEPPPQVDEPMHEPQEGEDEFSGSEELIPEGELRGEPAAHPDDTDELDVERLLHDPQYMPLRPLPPPESSTASHEERRRAFKKARKNHEMADRPLHVQYPPGPSEAAMWCSEESHHFVLGVTIDCPSSEEEWRKILKDPKKFTAKSIQKGAEVSWAKLNPTQRKAMAEAKSLEVDSWITNKVCEKAGFNVPKHRLMKMRWVLVLKSTDNPSKVKAKARIVILGYSDPDGEFLDKAAPTLARRSRQMVLNYACFRRWRTLKADARAAFLQGSESQRHRDVFAIPVEELGNSMNVSKGETVRLLRAAYGLVSAPRERYRDVHAIATSCSMRRLKCEPCVWIYVDAKGVTQGLIGSHVDDFIVTGNESCEGWLEVLKKFHSSLSWSPWEVDPYTHCGVVVHQNQDYSFNLDHSEYCKQIKQIDIDKKSEGVTPQELSQARAVLGAVQWRVTQTGPQHAAKLSLLQSLLPTSMNSKDVLHQINKLVRETYSQRGLSVKVEQLDAWDSSDLILIGWADAAVANRPSLASTGGYAIGLCHKRILEGHRSPVNLISWRSGKLHRTARSSLSAEVQALAEAEQELMYCRALWGELEGGLLDLRTPEQLVKKTAGAMITDAKSLFDSFHKGEGASSAFSLRDKYSALELMSVSESMRRSETALLWVSSDAQLADGFTKPAAQDQIRLFLEKGQQWVVRYDPTFLAAKKKGSKLMTEGGFPPDEELIPDETWGDMIRRQSESSSKIFRPSD